MLRTMELIAGVEPMTQYDGLARPIRKAFTDHPNFRAYDALQPGVSMSAVNLPGAPLAAESAHLDFSRPDAADARILNEAIWKSVRGNGSPMPPPRVSVGARN
jgi:hypothetical protein